MGHLPSAPSPSTATAAVTATAPVASGIEFYTSVPPDRGTVHARWTGPREGVVVEDGYAKINVLVTRNTQIAAVAVAADDNGVVLSPQKEQRAQRQQLLADHTFATKEEEEEEQEEPVEMLMAA